ncbi:hypothetical protein F4777DRAFT_555233 [Nemania sp. FL0916]|nr:hypothetical protein F4777DRAFT_555233 [Nemania sp. FL0916]
MLLPDLSSYTPHEQADFLNSPALEPPDGAKSNLDNPSNSNVLSITITALALALSSVFVFIRLYVSWVISRTFLITDVIMIISFILSVAYHGIVLDAILRVGFLVHQWDVTYRDFFYVLKGFYITTTIFGFYIMLIKFAIVLEWVRIFNPMHTRNLFYWASWTILAINALYYVPSFFIFNFACRPWARFYNPFVKGTCYDLTKGYLASGVTNFVVDVAVFLLPQNVIWNLQMSVKKKIGIAAIFSVGLFSVASAGIRLVWLVQFTESKDVLYSETSLALWVTAEMTSALIVFCVPSVPQFVQIKAVRRLLRLSTKHGTSHRDSSGTGQVRYEEHTRPYQKIGGLDAMPLEGLQPPIALHHTNMSGLQLDASRQANLKILRTTEIFTSRETIENDASDASTVQQYPWMDRRA